MGNSNKDRIRALLKSIETGDPAGVAVVNESRYIQHNPQTHEGSEGLAALFARLAKSNPRVNVVRAFEDGDFVFAHTEYDFATRRIGFEVFRFEDGLAVEHWDNIQPRLGPNPAGRSMVDGPTHATDLSRTETNRERARDFVSNVLIEGNLDRLVEFTNGESLVQHDPNIGDGAAEWRAALDMPTEHVDAIRYERLHRVLAEGSFVLCVSEGRLGGRHAAFYDLLRLDGDRIVERWNTVEHIAPRSEWRNDNGKF